jgi:iron complex transport system substrate-binding protein
MGGLIYGMLRRGRGLASLLTSLTIGALIASCRPAPVLGGRPGLVDDAGDTLALAAPARRVVSLIPAATELLFAIGAGAVAVGRSSYCDYPPAAQSVPDLGDGI